MLESEYSSPALSTPKIFKDLIGEAYNVAGLCEFAPGITKVGCVIALKDKTYSAPNSPIPDKEGLKILDKVPYRDHLTLHAETAAIVEIYKNNQSLINRISGGSLYLTHMPRSDEVKMAVALGVKRILYVGNEDSLHAASLKLRKSGESGSERAEVEAINILKKYILIEEVSHESLTEFDGSLIKIAIENANMICDCEFKSCAVFVDSTNKVTGLFRSQYMYGLKERDISGQPDGAREKMIVRPAMLAMMEPLRTSGLISDAVLCTTVASCTSCLAPIYSAGFKRIIYDKLFTDGSCMKKCGSNEALFTLSKAIKNYGVEYRNSEGKYYSECIARTSL